MLIEESIRRQNELRNCLYEMASTCMDETEIRSISIKLKALYTDGFRHNYFDFFPLIVEIAKRTIFTAWITYPKISKQLG